MYHILFIRSSVSGHLGCFHVLVTQEQQLVLAIVNSTAVNTGLYMSLSTQCLFHWLIYVFISGFLGVYAH